MADIIVSLQAARPALPRDPDQQVPDADIDGAPRLLVPVAIGDLFGTCLEPPRYVLRPLIPRGVATLLGGHGGSGKTVLAVTIGAHVAAGRFWAGLEVEQGRVLFVSLEDPGSVMLYRLRKIVEAYGLDPRAVADNLVIVDGSAGDAALVGEQNEFGVRRLLPTATMEELRELAHGTGLIVIDNASDAFDGDENHRRHVRTFIRMLTGIARDNDAGLILLAHIDKAAARYGSNGNSYSGSTAWHNSVRSRLALIEVDGTVELRQEKLNFGKPAEPLVLRWSEHGVLMPVASSGDIGQSDQDTVLAAMRAAATAGADVGAARTGPATAQTVLATFDELPAHLRGPRGRDAFWSALSRLQAQGAVEVREFRGANRHVRRCLVEVGAPNVPGEGARANPPHPLRSGARALGSDAPAAPVCVNAELTRTSATGADAWDRDL